jgi:alcohol dehydrogenase
MGVAAFAEYTLVAEASAVKVPTGLDPRDTCVFGCAVLCGAGTALNTAGVGQGDSVAVVGLGAVGLSAILGAKVAGAKRIVAIDRLEAKLAPASALGATDAVVSDEQTEDRVAELTVGGVDHAIEASGTLEGFELAMNLVRRGGTVTVLGLPGPSVHHDLALARMVVKGVTIRGSYLGSCVTSDAVPHFIDLYRLGRLPVDQLVTHHIRLDDINEALDRLADGEALRQVIEL